MILTVNTGLKWEHETRMTVLPDSGSVVLFGSIAKKSAQQDIYGLHQYRLEGGRLQKLRHVELPCEHEPKKLLGVKVEEQELLAVACKHCGDIKLMNLETGETHVAYKSEKMPDTLCHGDAGRIWIYCRDNTVTELNCTSKTFTVTRKTFDTSAEYHFMCYLPAPHRALIYSTSNWVEAVSAETGQQLWKLQGQVDGKTIQPAGMTLDAEHQLLLTADSHGSRILVLDPETGSPLESFPMPHPQVYFKGYVGQLGSFDLCWSQGRLLLLHNSGIKCCISQLVDPLKGKLCVPCFCIKRKHS